MSVIPGQPISSIFFHIGLKFCFFPAFYLTSTFANSISPFFLGWQRSVPNLEFSPSHVSIGFSQIAFPIIVLPEGDRTDVVQEERLCLPYWTMILAICVVVDESKCLDISIWEFSIKLKHLPFWAAVTCDADGPCSAQEPESSFTMPLTERSPAFVFLKWSFQLHILEVATFRASPILYPLRLWHPVFFIARGMGTNLCTKL